MEKIYALIEKLEKRVAHIEKLENNNDLNLLVKKVEEIERFLNNRTRGYYERSRSR